MEQHTLEPEKDKKITVIAVVEDVAVQNRLRTASIKRQWIVASLVNLCTLSAGMALGYPAISLTELTSAANSPMILDQNQASWFASINAITCPLGGLLASYILDKLGRKFSLILINVLSIISWALVSWSDKGDVNAMYNQLLVARLIIGIAGGLSSSPVTVYTAEISHPKLRGRLTVLASVCIAFGVLTIYFLGYLFQNDWRFIAMISMIISIVCLFISIFLPESPRWLARKHKFKKAENAFYVLNGKGNNHNECLEVSKEVETLIEECKKPPRDENTTKISLWQKLQRPNVYKPLGVLITYFTFQQLCGLFVIVVYIGQLATAVGVTINIFIFTVITGVCRFSGVVVSVLCSDKFGRRSLAIVSGLGTCLSTMAVAICMWYPTTKSHWYASLFILFYVFISTIGYLTIPFALVGELYPPDIRGFAAGLNVCYVYTLAFILIKSYPFVSAALGVKFILTFMSCASLIGVAFIYRFVPETKGKTLKELEELYK